MESVHPVPPSDGGYDHYVLHSRLTPFPHPKHFGQLSAKNLMNLVNSLWIKRLRVHVQIASRD